MARYARNKKSYQPKEDKGIIIEGVTILNDPEKTQYASGRIKSVFDIVTPRKYLLTCVDWNNHRVEKGDELSYIKGQLNGEVFLVWKLMISKKASKQEEQVNEN